ncbi:MAG: heme ABC exporter ATP-binding protein CcmA [Myxococcota bacterium]
MSSGVPLLEGRGITHRYGSRVALSDVSFRAHAGEALAVIGPNGAGKTTLFRILLGLLTPESGELRMEDRPVSPRDPALRTVMGVVFQDPSLDARLTVRENLTLFASMHLLRGARARERVDELLRMLELTDRADELVQKLSGGLKRRVELARALVHRPRVLILDEPTTGVDLVALRTFWRFIDQLRQRDGLCVLVTTHRSDEAERCERVMVLNLGKVVAEGTPEALISRVGGDVIVLRTTETEPVARAVRDRLGLQATSHDGEVRVPCTHGPELIPRVLEATGGWGHVGAVTLRRPSIADAFAVLTGSSLEDEPMGGGA